MTDISFLCGSIELGVSAGMGFKSNVYLSVYARPPHHPLSQARLDDANHLQSTV